MLAVQVAYIGLFVILIWYVIAKGETLEQVSHGVNQGDDDGDPIASSFQNYAHYDAHYQRSKQVVYAWDIHDDCVSLISVFVRTCRMFVSIHHINFFD